MDTKRVFCKFTVDHIRGTEEDGEMLESHEIVFESTDMHIDRFLEKCEQIARAAEYVVPEGCFVFEHPKENIDNSPTINELIHDTKAGQTNNVRPFRPKGKK